MLCVINVFLGLCNHDANEKYEVKKKQIKYINKYNDVETNAIKADLQS